MSPAKESIPPLHRSLVVRWSQEASFHRFTAEIASWWPLRTHSVGQQEAETVIIDGRVGGRIYERMRGGRESTWGTITAWEPPRRLAFTWHPGHGPDRAQEIEVRFTQVGTGTRLDLVHTGWERLGEEARRARRAYPLGWSYVLRLWADRRSSPLVLCVNALMWALGPLQRRAVRKMQAAAPIERPAPTSSAPRS